MNPLDFPEFPFSSPLAKAIIDPERVRADLGEGTTAPEVFTQLRTLFQLLSSIMSERIEDGDSLEPESLIRWSTYVLEGLLTDLRRLAKLGDKDFVTEGLLVPAIARGLASSRFTADQALALTIIARKVDVKAADLSSAFTGSAATRSQDIRKLLDRGVIEPVAKGKRSYRLRLASELTPLLVRELDQLGFLPRILRDSE